MNHRRGDLASLLFAAALAVLSGGAGALSWDPGPVPGGAPRHALEVDAPARAYAVAGVGVVGPTLRPSPAPGRTPTSPDGDRPGASAADARGVRLRPHSVRAAVASVEGARRASPLALGHPATAPPIAV